MTSKISSWPVISAGAVLGGLLAVSYLKRRDNARSRNATASRFAQARPEDASDYLVLDFDFAEAPTDPARPAQLKMVAEAPPVVLPAEQAPRLASPVERWPNAASTTHSSTSVTKPG